MSRPDPGSDDVAYESDGSGGLTLSDVTSRLEFNKIAPDWLTDNEGFLRTFATNPRQTILGVIATFIIGGVIDIWETFLDGITLIVWGTDLETTNGQKGILDIPLVAADLATEAASPVGEGLLLPLELVFDASQSTIASLGIIAWPVAVAVVVATIVILDRAGRRIGRATISAIPVVGSFVENLLP
jgi:hypothetical protein